MDNLVTTYRSDALGVTSVLYDYGYKGSVGITGPIVIDIMNQILNRLKENTPQDYLAPGGPFDGYIIETWSTVREDCPSDLRSKAGLTYPDSMKTQINPNYSWGVYPHEFGHRYGLTCDILDDYHNTNIGLSLTAQFNRIRPSSCMPQAERFAEDFKYFFGANGYGYGETGKSDTDVLPYNIPGLKIFIQGCWPVYRYLNGKGYSNFNYLENNYQFIWWINNRWECFYLGYFYYWTGSAWQVFYPF